MNNQNTPHDIASFFKDRKGNIAIIQWPNVPLMSWLVFKILSTAITTESIKNGCSNISMAFLLTWAYLEITSGVSYFRRALGVIVMLALLAGYLR